MRWVHNRRFGSWLALAALALQIVVSFGHVHLDRVRRTFRCSGCSRSGTPGALPEPQPGNDAETIIARFAPRSISLPTLLFPRRRNWRCRLSRNQSSTSIASRPFSSCRGERRFNPALHRSPDLRSLLIFGSPRVLVPAMPYRIERGISSHFDLPRQHDRPRAGRLAISLQHWERSVMSSSYPYRAHRGYFLARLSAARALALSAAKRRPRISRFPRSSSRATKPKPAKPRRVRASAPHRRRPSRRPQSLMPKSIAFDAARSNLYTTIGTSSDVITHATIDALPGGDQQPVEKILLQAPGVSQDSAASGLLHVRNDHANVQFRINGVMLPDGLTGFGSILDASWIGSIALVVGALPAEYGLRTVGLVDITTRADIFNNSGQVSIYGGSQGTLTPTIQYGGTFGSTCPATPAPPPGTHALPSADCFPGVQYFFTGRYLQTKEGIENSMASYSPIHDFSQQEKGFAYMSTFVDPYTRLSLIAGTSTSTFQIPNTPGQPVGLGTRAGHERVRRHHLQFGAAQREPVRGYAIRRAGAAAIDQRL